MTVRENCRECSGDGWRYTDVDGVPVANATFRCEDCRGAGWVEYDPADEQADRDYQATKEGDL